MNHVALRTSSPPAAPSPSSTADLVTALSKLREAVLSNERRHAGQLAEVSPAYLPSARNLIHYLGLRQHDLRALQRALATRGLSSLGRCEPHTLATLDAVLRALGAPGDLAGLPVDFES